MAELHFVHIKYREHIDKTQGYSIIGQRAVGVEVCIRLSPEESALISSGRRGKKRRLVDLLGPAIRWEFQHSAAYFLNAHHSIESNPHHVHTPQAIAEHTLASIQAVLARLSSS